MFLDRKVIKAAKEDMQALFELLLKPTSTVHGMRVDPIAAKRLLALVVNQGNRKWKVSLSPKAYPLHKSLTVSTRS